MSGCVCVLTGVWQSSLHLFVPKKCSSLPAVCAKFSFGRICLGFFVSFLFFIFGVIIEAKDRLCEEQFASVAAAKSL